LLGVAWVVTLQMAPAQTAPAQTTPATAPAPISGPISHDRSRRVTPIVEVVNRCKSAVVNISSTQIIKVQQSPFGPDALFDQFFDMPGMPAQEVRATSVGSGIVIHPSGYIVTNAHVVARTIDRKVIFADKKEYDAQVVAIDPDRDLAILKIDAGEPLPTVPLGRSSDLMVGETVIAIGNPLGYQHTVTHGIVSAVDRSLKVENNVTFKGLIQTDASINPGNSGGPLLNLNAELIGVNSAIRTDAQNIGFAISVDTLREVLPAMLDVERRYGFIAGVKVRDIAAQDDGCVVDSVAPHSPADKAGIKPGDIVHKLSGQDLRDAIDFQIGLIGRKSGESVVLSITTGSEPVRDISLTLASRPRPDGAKLLRSRFGIEAKPLDPKEARDMGIRPIRALLVSDVEPKSPAAGIGLRAGDIIDRIGNFQAGSLSDVGDLLEKVEPGQTFVIGVIRVQGRMIYRASIPLAVKAPPAA
jgi:serine protease Do